MAKKETVSFAELLPSFDELRARSEAKAAKKATKAAKNLAKLTEALDLSTEHHAKRLGKRMIAAAKCDETYVRYAVRENFEYTEFKPALEDKEARQFALDCVKHVADQLYEVLAPEFPDVNDYGAHTVDPRGLQDDFKGIAVEAPITVSWGPALK